MDEYERVGPGKPYEKTARSGIEFSEFLKTEVGLHTLNPIDP
jgi:hypothetical protein